MFYNYSIITLLYPKSKTVISYYINSILCGAKTLFVIYFWPSIVTVTACSDIMQDITDSYTRILSFKPLNHISLLSVAIGSLF